MQSNNGEGAENDSEDVEWVYNGRISTTTLQGGELGASYNS